MKKEQIGVINIGRPVGPNMIHGQTFAEEAVSRGLIFELVVDELFRGHICLYRPLDPEAVAYQERQFASACGGALRVEVRDE